MDNTSDVFDTTESQYDPKVVTSFDDYKRTIQIGEPAHRLDATFYFDDGSVSLKRGLLELGITAEEMKVLIQQYSNFPSTSELQHLYCASFY
jgi:hypothetical protein